MARKFKFALEVVLRLRQRREASARAGFTAAKSTVDEIMRHVDRLDQAYHRQNRWARAAVLGEGADDFAPYRQIVSTLRAEALSQRQHLLHAGMEFTRRRTELLEAMRQRKALQRLKENLALKHEASAARKLSRQMDDSHAAFRHNQLADVLSAAGLTETLP